MVLNNDGGVAGKGKIGPKYNQYFLINFKVEIENWWRKWLTPHPNPSCCVFNQIPHVLIFMLRLRALSLVDTSYNYHWQPSAFSVLRSKFSFIELCCGVVTWLLAWLLWHWQTVTIIILKIKRNLYYFIIVTKHTYISFLTFFFHYKISIFFYLLLIQSLKGIWWLLH